MVTSKPSPWLDSKFLLEGSDLDRCKWFCLFAFRGCHAIRRSSKQSCATWMRLNPMIIFIWIVNYSVSSSTESLQPYLDHIFQSMLCTAGLSCYHSGKEHVLSIEFSIDRSRTFLCFSTSQVLDFKSNSTFWHIFNRFSHTFCRFIAFL